MGSFDPSEKEIGLLSKMFLEAAAQKGTRVTISLVDKDNTDRTNQNDPNYSYFEDEDIDIILEERPDIKTLKSLNWFNEEDELLPILAYFSIKDVDDEYMEILKGTKVNLPYKVVNSEMGEKYIIEDIKFSNHYVWVGKLVPDRDRPDYQSDVDDNSTQDSDFEFLKVSDE